MSVSVEIKKISPLLIPVPATVTVTVNNQSQNHENLEDEFWAEVGGSKERLDEEEHKGNATDEGKYCH